MSVRIAGHVLRRNVYLPSAGGAMVVAGATLAAMSPAHAPLGWLGLWSGGILAVVTLARNALPLARPATFDASEDALTGRGRARGAPRRDRGHHRGEARPAAGPDR